MELWIRSQDKEMLAKTNRIDIDTNGKTIVINGFETIIGKYETKERALEVLDEIQNILKPQMIISKVGKPIAEICDGTVYREPDEYDFKELSTYVYEMPKD